jgi:hypothetical protein
MSNIWTPGGRCPLVQYRLFQKFPMRSLDEPLNSLRAGVDRERQAGRLNGVFDPNVGKLLDANRRLVQLSNKATVPKPPSAQILTIARAPFDLAASSFTA